MLIVPKPIARSSHVILHVQIADDTVLDDGLHDGFIKAQPAPLRSRRSSQSRADFYETSRILRRTRYDWINGDVCKPYKKSMIALLTSFGRSCCVQWPQPGSMMVPRSW